MYPSYRYHVTTIAAIFIALGVGIVIGSSFVQSAIVQRQTRRLDELKTQFTQEIAPLREENLHYAEFVARISTVVLDAKLSGMRVALVQTGDYPDTVQRIRETLEQAGATISSVTVIDRLFPARAQTTSADLQSKLRPNHPDLPADASAPLAVLAWALSRGNGDADVAVLEDERLLTHDGSYSLPADRVILVGGATQDYESRADTVDTPFISRLRDAGMKVVFAEPSTAGISYIPVVHNGEISTVDNADTDIGRLAVALALIAPPGDYGSKKTARNGLVPIPQNIPWSR
ncbi:MAG: copper transporter [Chthonomonadales bacterium]